MCTVSYVPLGSGNFILTSNRDENPNRVTLEPGKPACRQGRETTITEATAIICPKDFKAGGSWIAMSTYGKVACLLNGAFIKHQHEPPYIKSRGLVLMEYFSFPSAIELHNKIDLNGIENFTLLMLEDGLVYELRWDGKEKFFHKKEENKAHLWSSCTLYDEETAGKKDLKFHTWLGTNEKVNVEEIEFFHGLNNSNGFLLEGPIVKTVSITSIEKSFSSISMNYHDLITGHDMEKTEHLR